MKALIGLLIVLAATCCCSQNCSSGISHSDGWKLTDSAPKDGTVIEMAQTYGIAPTYGLYKWSNQRIGGETMWQSATDPQMGTMDSGCLYWRPYKGSVSKYQDPTGGEQNSLRYWCTAAHVRYDPKKDACVR